MNIDGDGCEVKVAPRLFFFFRRSRKRGAFYGRRIVGATVWMSLPQRSHTKDVSPVCRASPAQKG
ncbi:MAG: hypothetical protein FJ225_11965, partial [Lentisphaerae bacterium]|nr:hypothetical protein [Lentisphaerota bacterium]